MKTHDKNLFAIILLILFSVGLVTCCFEDEKSEPAPKPVKITKKSEPKAKNETEKKVEEKPTPPPLLPAKAEPDFTLDDIMKKMKKRDAKNKKFEEDKSVLYRYTDSSGKTHMVSSLYMVPLEYRNNVITVSKTTKSANRGKRYVGLKPRENSGKQNKINQAYNTKYKKALKSLKDLNDALKRARSEVPNCSPESENSGNSGDAQPDVTGIGCMSSQRNKIESLQRRLDEAKKDLKTLKEDARKAGVPPGYLR